MRRKTVSILGGVAVLLCLARAGMADTQAVDGVVAYVNEHAITSSDVREAIPLVLQQAARAGQDGGPRPKPAQVFEKALNLLIERRLIIDAYGKDTYAVPPNVLKAANWYQRDPGFVKGAPAISAADPARTQILFNRRVTYKGREDDFEVDEQSRLQRVFMGAHLIMEFDMPLWREVEELVISAARGRD